MHVRVVWQIKEIATCTEEQISLADGQIIIEALILKQDRGLRYK